MKCINCEKEFSPKSNVQKYCFACRKRKCLSCNKEFSIKQSQWNIKYCSRICYYKTLKGKYPINLKEKQGIKPRTYHLNKRDKHGSAFDREWRKAVFERDEYTCIICKQKGGKLNADHIKPFKAFPELRYDINNGRTLCIECHKKTDSYGWKNYWNT
jgi:5-methylcytosine-specific restriction endonuclease McrA